ncbi:MAG: hypothetical protein HN350_04720 [Phycisphaerales bacterium]|nr:hypothetical protein [Phycisphaerales bacterium]
MNVKSVTSVGLALIMLAVIGSAVAKPKRTAATKPAAKPTSRPTTKPATRPSEPKLVYSLDSGSYFSISVRQDNKLIAISPKDRSAKLKKAPFALVFTFKGTGPAFITTNISFDSASYDAVLGGKSIEKVPGMEGTGMAEGVRNNEHEVFIRKDCFHYWHYEDPNKSRFDKVKPGEDRIVCTRTIDKFMAWDDNNKRGPQTPISKIKGKALYMAFARFKKGAYNPKIGLQLEGLKIIWR